MISDSELMNYYIRAVSSGKTDRQAIEVLKHEMKSRGITPKNLRFIAEFEIERGDLLSTERVEMRFEPK